MRTPRRQRKQRRLAHARSAHHTGASTGGHMKHQPVERRRPRRAIAHGKRKLRCSTIARSPCTPAQSMPMRPHGSSPRHGPRSPQQPHQHALACPRCRHDQHGPRQQVSRLDEQLRLIDALAHGARRHADELRRHAGLPAHADHGTRARKHKRQDLAPGMGAKQTPTPHAMQMKHLLQRLINLRQTLDQRKIHARQRHQKDRGDAHARRPQPNEQQDHHAGNRCRLNKRKRRRHQAGKRQRPHRGSRHHDAAHRGKRQPAQDTRTRACQNRPCAGIAYQS